MPAHIGDGNRAYVRRAFMNQSIAVFADLVGTVQCVLWREPPGGHCGQQVSQRRLRGTPKRGPAASITAWSTA